MIRFWKFSNDNRVRPVKGGATIMLDLHCCTWDQGTRLATRAELQLVPPGCGKQAPSCGVVWNCSVLGIRDFKGVCKPTAEVFVPIVVGLGLGLGLGLRLRSGLGLAWRVWSGLGPRELRGSLIVLDLRDRATMGWLLRHGHLTWHETPCSAGS